MILHDLQFQLVIDGQIIPVLVNDFEDVREYAREVAALLGVSRHRVGYQWRSHVTASTEWVDVGDYPDWDALRAEFAGWVPPDGLRDVGGVPE